MLVQDLENKTVWSGERKEETCLGVRVLHPEKQDMFITMVLEELGWMQYIDELVVVGIIE